MRLGIQDASGQEAVTIAKIAEDCGIVALTVHGRTRAQGYSGTADYHAIGRVKEAVRIPVIGNGDVLGGEDAKKMLALSGCDGVMIGRGGLGNPWIFKIVENVVKGGEPLRGATTAEKKKALLKHFELELVHRDEKTALLHMRRIACWYFKNLPGAAEFRGVLNTCQTVSEVRSLIEGFE